MTSTAQHRTRQLAACARRDPADNRWEGAGLCRKGAGPNQKPGQIVGSVPVRQVGLE